MKLQSLEDTKNVSIQISKIIQPGDIIFLYGDIGTGKTTFVRFLINNLEVKKGLDTSEVLSPTFNIAYDYNLGDLKIIHYDLYRLKNNNDISQLAIFDNVNEEIKIIEWPELIEAKPIDRIEMYFKYSSSLDYRLIRIKGFGKWNNHKFHEI